MSVIGAVSPPGGDISEPVSQATLRIVKVFWGLDSALAYKRHFPAINWLNSYSLYTDMLSRWYEENVAEDWNLLKGRMMALLQEEAELEEVVKLVGMDALSPSDRLKLEEARSIREDYLLQDAFHDVDAYADLKKQHRIMTVILRFYDDAVAALQKGAPIEKLVSLPVREAIARFKYMPSEETEKALPELLSRIQVETENAARKEGM